jgi:undecaprenyl-diphosphatase
MADIALVQPALGYGEAILYGLIQGLTEFLPVSSSGHLALAHLLGLGSIPKDLELAFDVLLHAATLLAIVAAFQREITLSIRADWRHWLVILVAVIPAGLAGLAGRPLVEAAGERWWAMGIAYLYTAGLLIFGEQRSKALSRSDQVPTMDLARITWREALVVGLFQILALLPGVSRSGSTIAGGLITGLSPALAVGFAFIVGLPLIAAAAAKDAIDPEAGFLALHAAVGTGPLLVAFVASLGSGLGAIALLKWVVNRRRLVWFAIYCALIGVVCLIKEFGHAATGI